MAKISEVVNVSVLRLDSRSEKHLCFKQEEIIMSIKVKFVWKNDTPGTSRYQEVDDSGQPKKNDADGMVIGALYLRKAAMDGMNSKPKQFTLIIDDIQ